VFFELNVGGSPFQNAEDAGYISTELSAAGTEDESGMSSRQPSALFAVLWKARVET